MQGVHPTLPDFDTPDFDILWDYDNPAATEERFRSLLATIDSAHDPDYHAQLLTQLARAQGLQRNFEDAHRTLDLAEATLTPATPVARSRYCLERGRVFNSSGSPEKARPFFLEAMLTAQSAGAVADYYAVDAAHMMGIIESRDEGLAWNLKAVAIAQQSENERARSWLGSLYNNIGWIFHDQGRYDEALDSFYKSKECWQSNGKEKEARIARWCVGRTLRSLGRLEEALEMQVRLLAEGKALGEESGYVNEEIAECLIAQGHIQAARPYAQKAHEILSKDAWLPLDQPARLTRLQQVGAGVAEGG